MQTLPISKRTKADIYSLKAVLLVGFLVLLVGFPIAKFLFPNKEWEKGETGSILTILKR